MRAEPYAEAHERTWIVSRDRRQTPATLRALLRWAHRQYVTETPNLDHSGIHLDDDGAPTMAAAARRYLGLSKKDDRTDNWVELAGRTDEDGFYLTPLRLAIETQPRERRLFLRDLVPEVLFPSEVALLHGIPAWCMADVIHQSLAMLWRTFRERPPVRPNYLERSESQRVAEDARLAS